ncbi:MAG TPA: YjcZ family sporulation protein [Bacillales bacterium]|nr:YjcZ family sporulation protein [Bacillales bacterium]
MSGAAGIGDGFVLVVVLFMLLVIAGILSFPVVC